MGSNSDQLKGRAKEAVGTVIGDESLESEGKADRRAGAAKEKIDHAGDKVEEVVEEAKHKIGHAIDEVKGAVHRK